MLQHQRRRAAAPEVVAQAERLVSGGMGTFPMLALDASVAAVDAEVELAVAQIDGEQLRDVPRLRENV